jgi:hypothetical protein
MQQLADEVAVESIRRPDDLMAEISILTQEMARFACRIERRAPTDDAGQAERAAETLMQSTKRDAAPVNPKEPECRQENVIANGIADLYDRLGGFISTSRTSARTNISEL